MEQHVDWEVDDNGARDAGHGSLERVRRDPWDLLRVGHPVRELG